MPFAYALVTALVFLVPPSASLDDVTWEEVKPDDGKFTATIPANELKKEQRVIDSPLGKATATTWSAFPPKCVLNLMVSELRPGTTRNLNLQKSLDGVRDRSLAVLRASATSEKKITIGKRKYPGRDVRAESVLQDGSKAIVRMRIYIVQDRLYTMVTDCPEAHEARLTPMIDKFLDSLTIKD
jgi:hypothetical protein